jgi:hypothetical protein
MTDVTNRCIKICRRLEELEYILSLNEARTQTELDELRDEKKQLEIELEELQPAT